MCTQSTISLIILEKANFYVNVACVSRQARNRLTRIIGLKSHYQQADGHCNDILTGLCMGNFYNDESELKHHCCLSVGNAENS